MKTLVLFLITTISLMAAPVTPAQRCAINQQIASLQADIEGMTRELRASHGPSSQGAYRGLIDQDYARIRELQALLAAK